VGRTADRRAYEALLQQVYAGMEPWYLPGVCQVCAQAVGLLADHQYGGTPEAVNFRERLVCPTCQLNARQRLMAHLVREAISGLGDASRIYLYEQVTHFFQWARTSLPGDVLGSEYLGHDVPGGAIVDGVRHEDALALSFPDASLDVIISQEVLEHVPDVDPAIAESARVLRPGGRFLFTVPFHTGSDVTVQRAKLVDGEVIHLLEPEFHGNPVSPEGSLVFFDHGWDMLDRFRALGFEDVSLLSAWSALYGYLGGGMLIVFSATRSAAS
jgi:SAM-dependent methyltransferase